MVRQAVLKNKDPGQLLEEMEQVDEMGKIAEVGARSSWFNFLFF